MGLPLDNCQFFNNVPQSVNWKVGSPYSRSIELKEDAIIRWNFWTIKGTHSVLLSYLIIGIQCILEGPGNLVMGPFFWFDLLILRTVPTCSWQLFIGNIFLSTIQDFVTMRFKQADIFKLTKILIIKKVVSNKGQDKLILSL